MDLRTEQAYQQRIAELEVCVADLAAQLAERDATIIALQQQVTVLSKQVAELLEQVARLSKNSSNSSKPPSSDIVKPPPPPLPSGEKRSIGGQKGHPRHEREPFTPAQLNRVVDYTMNRCPDCNAVVRPMDLPPRKLQQVEMPEVPVEVVEHRSHGYFCSHCRKVHYASLPRDIQNAGLVGPRLTAQIAFLKSVGHCSFSTIQKYCHDILHLTISRGQLVNVLQKTSRALADCHEMIQKALPGEKSLNTDESGHYENARRFWTWAFRASGFTFFKIEPSRGSQVLLALLGREFSGIVGCDYYSAYRKYGKDCGVLLQFCLAHFIRDVKFLTTLSEPMAVAYGQRLLKALRALFHVVHQRDIMEPEVFQQALEQARDVVITAGLDAPRHKPSENVAARFRHNAESYFRFVTTPGLEPTNNLAEQAIRFIVLDRRVTQGTRSERGRQWSERIWTTIATCAQQKRNVFEFLFQSISNYLAGRPTPSLLPSGP